MDQGHQGRRTPTERSFGISVGVVALTLGAVSWWRGDIPVAVAIGVIGAVLLIAGVIAPRLLRVPNRIWWRFAQILGWVNSRILLTVVFVAVLTPLSVMLRLLGRNPLRPAQSGTNWSPYAARRRDPRHYERMF